MPIPPDSFGIAGEDEDENDESGGGGGAPFWMTGS